MIFYFVNINLGKTEETDEEVEDLETDEEGEDLETEEDVVVLEEIGEVASVIVVGMIEEMVDVMVTVEEEVVVSEDEEVEVAAVELATTATMRDIWQEIVPKETEEIEEDDRLILMGFFKESNQSEYNISSATYLLKFNV